MKLHELFEAKNKIIIIKKDDSSITLKIGSETEEIKSFVDMLYFFSEHLAEEGSDDFYVSDFEALTYDNENDKNILKDYGDTSIVKLVEKYVEEYNKTKKKPFISLSAYVGSGNAPESGLILRNKSKEISGDYDYETLFDREVMQEIESDDEEEAERLQGKLENLIDEIVKVSNASFNAVGEVVYSLDRRDKDAGVLSYEIGNKFLITQLTDD